MTGKMARAADNTDSQSGTSLSGGGSASEEALAKIWTEVLRLPSVEADANFFVTADHATIVYSWSYLHGQGGGIWSLPVP